MLKIVQIALALLILTVVTLAVLVIVGVMGQEDAMRIGVNVSSIIGIGLVASIALTAVLGIGSRSGEDGAGRD